MLLIHKKPLRVDQLYYFYHLLRYVEDENSKTIEEGQARLFWPKIYGGSQIRESNQVFKTLAGSGNTVTGAIASIMTQKEHSYFANLAVHDWQTLSKAPHARLNKLYQEDCYRSVSLYSTGMVGDMLTAPTEFL